MIETASAVIARVTLISMAGSVYTSPEGVSGGGVGGSSG